MKKIFFLSLIVLFLFSVKSVSAAEAMVTFRFDDGLMSQYDNARPILAKYNYPASLYVFTDPLVAGDWNDYMKWSHVKDLQDNYNWEIGSHTKSHPYLLSLSTSELIEELSGSKTILQQQGFNISSFVSPFGTYGGRELATVARFYENHGSAWPYDLNTFPYDDYGVYVQEVRGSTSIETVKGWIDQAKAENKWLVLLFHGIVELSPGEYEYSKDGFETIVDYVNSSNLPVVNITEGLKLKGENLIPNHSFTEPLSNDWVSEGSAPVIDQNNNGAYPSPGASLKIGQEDSIYTKEFIEIDASKDYVLKSYFNCQNFISGGVDIFIDEYDAEGNWLNWTWQTGIWSSYVGYRGTVYTPGENTKKILIWMGAAEGSDLTCYLDNLIFSTVDGSSLPEPPEPGPNLILNPSFDLLTDGWADSWLKTNDSANIVDGKLELIDTSSVWNESFIDVEPNMGYTFSLDFDCLDFTSGGIDIFFDEYDAEGNWINWEWKTGIWSSFSGKKEITYFPNSDVEKLLVWIERVPGSDLSCSVDNLVLAENGLARHILGTQTISTTLTR